MKKRILTGAIGALLCLTMVTTQTSCIGSFSLFNRLLGWNKNVSDKFVNELIFFGFWILPVYEVCALADVLVLNSIEFWSGSNPVACGNKVIEGNDGKYMVKADKKGYDIISLNDGSKTRLDFDTKTQTWSMSVNDGESRVLFSFIDETHVRVPAGAGNDWQTVELSEAGLYAYQQMALAGSFAAK